MRTSAHYSQTYKRFAVGVLLAAYVCNYIDRSIISMLMEPVRQEFRLTDAQLGLLVGPAFVLFYALMGIPIARLADRANRVNIMSVCVIAWSAMVMLCGVAVTFWQLLLARVGVGIGEAGCTPPAHSLIADYFESNARTRAISTYMLGMPLGTFASYLIGGWLNQSYGWRAAFVVVGLPGILLAILMKFTLREPPRENLPLSQAPRVPLSAVFATLWKRRALRHLAIGISLATIVTATAGSWVPTFLIRSHGMTTGELGLWLAAVTGVGGGIGMLLGGALIARYGARDERNGFRIIAAGTALITPALLATLLVPTKELSLVLLLPANLFLFCWFGPAFAFVQGLSDVSMRATTVATLLFTQVLFGGFIGGQAVGLLSTALQPTLATDSLRWAMVLAAPIALWAAAHFLLATRALGQDSAGSPAPAGQASEAESGLA
jgi:MFS family permease